MYLITHAILETGGASPLAIGIEVRDLILDENPVRLKKSIKLLVARITFNMFGIAAYDGIASPAGSSAAYHFGWFIIDKAITGGGEWIYKNYIVKKKQMTKYDICWNPKAMASKGKAPPGK